MNLVERVTAAADPRPDGTAVVHPDRQLTYRDLLDQVLRLRTVLTERGVTPGDRVGLMLPNVPEFAVAYYGILAAGAVVVPMNPLLKRQEVAHYLGDSGATLVLAWHAAPGEPAEGAGDCGVDLVEIRPSLAGVIDTAAAGDIEPREDDDDAVILFTSGTTGKPKGAQLTHHNLRRNAEVFGSEWLQLTPEDVVMGCLPMFHTFGQSVSLNCTMFHGAQLTLIERFTGDEALRLIEAEKVTVFVGVPTMYSAMLTAGETSRTDTSSLKLCISGGAPLPVEVLHSFEKRFDASIIEGYGLSESSPVASFNPPDGPRKVGSIGVPIPGVEMAIADEQGAHVGDGVDGEVLIRGHNVMKGYWNRQEATAETLDADGWLHTGDIGRRDEDGYYFIVDRKKALILRGGYNVYPREIEEVLYQHPAVREAAVVGIPHESLGEEVGAAVVLKDDTVSVDDIRDFVKERVAAYKYPRRVWAVPELPKTATGKILRREVEVPEATG